MILKKVLGLVICALALISYSANVTESNEISKLQDISENKNESNVNNTNNSDIRIEHDFMETPFTLDQLLHQSDIVIIGEITELLTEYNFINYDRNEYDSADAKLLCSLYNISIDEILLGEENLVGNYKKNVRLTLGGNTLPNNLEFNKKYTLCLMKMEQMEEDVYCISINQGIFQHEEDNRINNVGKIYNVNNFLEKIDSIEMKKRETSILETDAYKQDE